MIRSQPSPAEIITALDRASTRRTTPNGAGEVVWRAWGKGTPLVLFHGGTGSWMHRVRNIGDPARGFMLLVPEIPGSGASGNPPAAISPACIAAQLAAPAAGV